MYRLHDTGNDLDTVPRPNYGIIFNRLHRELLTNHNYELLTFSTTLKGLFNIPSWTKLTDKMNRTGNDPLAMYMRAEAAKVDTEAARLRQEAYRTSAAIKGLTDQAPQEARVKRDDQVSAPLQTLGDLLGISVGVATRPELNIIRTNFRRLTDYVQKTEGRATSNGHAFINILKMQEATIKLVMAQINITGMLFDNTTNNIRILQSSMISRAGVAEHAFAINVRDTLDIVNAWADLNTIREFCQTSKQILAALQELNNGRIPAAIIGRDLLKKSLQNFQTAIQKKHLDKHVVQLPLTHHYNHGWVAHALSGEVIHITMAIPVSSNPSLYTVYDISSQPVPLHPTKNTPTGYTEICHLVQYLAIAKADKGDKFLQFNKETMDRCRDTDMWDCTLPIPHASTLHPTCEMALLMNMPAAVHTLCDFQVTFGEAVPQRATAISQSRYILATQQESATLLCPSINQTMAVNTSAYSVVTVPCNCMLQSGNLSLMNTNHSCSPMDMADHVVSHAFNLPFIKAMGYKLKHLTGTTLSVKPVTLHFAQVAKLLNGQITASRLLADKAHSLSKAANEMARMTNSILPTMEGAYSMVGDFLTRPWMLVFTNTALLVTTLLTLHNTWKIVKVLAAASLISKANAGEMEDLKS